MSIDHSSVVPDVVLQGHEFNEIKTDHSSHNFDLNDENTQCGMESILFFFLDRIYRINWIFLWPFSG